MPGRRPVPVTAGLGRDALGAEFPSDAGMRAFAEASFSEIVGMLLKGHRVIHIHRSLSHGLELLTGDG